MFLQKVEARKLTKETKLEMNTMFLQKVEARQSKKEIKLEMNTIIIQCSGK